MKIVAIILIILFVVSLYALLRVASDADDIMKDFKEEK